MSNPTRTVPCPTCGKAVEWTASNRHRPFCSQRCKLLDLGAWASEEYNLPAQEDQPLSDSLSDPHHH